MQKEKGKKVQEHRLTKRKANDRRDSIDNGERDGFSSPRPVEPRKKQAEPWDPLLQELGERIKSPGHRRKKAIVAALERGPAKCLNEREEEEKNIRLTTFSAKKKKLLLGSPEKEREKVLQTGKKGTDCSKGAG